MNTHVTARQQAQLAFAASGQNLVVGNVANSPLSPAELAALTPESPLVVEYFDGGLTARVLHLCVAGVHYTLKQRRPVARVLNVDGETSFLNEVQRRADFTRFKADPVWSERFEHIVPTLYADYRQGIILSSWLPGRQLDHFSADIFRQILTTAVACEEAGLMEWDLCPGNIIEDQGRIWLFDFGYMYPFDPLVDFNSNGQSDPLFHACERFETRHFFGWLLRQRNVMSEAEQLALFRDLKVVAIEVYQQKLAWLTAHGASTTVLDWVATFIGRWQRMLQDTVSLASLFEMEGFRSHVLDVEDDLHGKSCTALTLQRLDFVEECICSRFAALQEGGALFYDNANKSQAELLAMYADKRRWAIQYQL